MAYSEEHKKKIVDDICDSIESGMSLRAVLRQKKTIPAKTFFEWIEADEDKRKQYARACEIRAEGIFDEILEIADDQDQDVLYDDEGKEIINHNVINRSRLRVDARKWALSKMNPKKYGDKLETTNEHKGEVTIIRKIID